VRKALPPSKFQIRQETLGIAFSASSEIRKSDLNPLLYLMQWRCQTTRSSHELQKIFIFSRMLDAAGRDAVRGILADGAFRAGLVVFSHQTVRQSSKFRNSLRRITGCG
jgi:hypothetical protein